uniref:Uncharacterized protein LOC104238700 n=1 Tax=Nicotiana sylvestris TaxID=4096 RepID=A0A1U7XWY5_NICSY|nr:PREDICTED: uncharacterized protein LOC104238700 [Nicotiana sylvestris]
MSNLSSDVNEEIQATTLAVVAFVRGGDAISTVEVEAPPSVEEIIPRNPDAKPYLQRQLEAVVVAEVFRSSLTAKCLAEFKDTFGIPDQVKIVPTDKDEVYTDHPRYCALYAYPFTIGYSLPFPPLVEEFCCYYRVCPIQLAPLVKILSKFAELADVEITLRHNVHLFMPTFYCGKMLNIRHRGSKSLVVKTDDKGSQQFWLNFFYVKIEFVVADVADFPEAWNHAPTARSLQLVTHLANGVRQALPCTVGIRDWSSFWQRYKPTPLRKAPPRRLLKRTWHRCHLLGEGGALLPLLLPPFQHLRPFFLWLLLVLKMRKFLRVIRTRGLGRGKS